MKGALPTERASLQQDEFKRRARTISSACHRATGMSPPALVLPQQCRQGGGLIDVATMRQFADIDLLRDLISDNKDILTLQQRRQKKYDLT